MPTLSRWFIRSSLGYLVTGFSLGAVMLTGKAVAAYELIGLMLPAHIELLLIGWAMQLTMGVAFWILPRLPAGGGRGAIGLAWLAFVLLNAGVWLVALASVFSPSDAARVVGRLAEAVGATAFGVHAWRRVRRANVARTG
jgi:heme/copper-type cytochrome/quinol oxidase subunit 1